MMWVERKVTVTNPEGLHARPARDLLVIARKFACEIRIVKGDRVADAKSIFDIMILGAEKGEVLLVRARGVDAEDAIRAVIQVITAVHQ
jgi:phosphotransferase system HPr (HPr) family protein